MDSNRSGSRPGRHGPSSGGVRPLSRGQRWLLALAALGFVLDVGSTWAILTSTAAREANPVMRQMMSLLGVPLGIVVTKLLAVVILLVALALFPRGWRNRTFTLVTALIALVGIGFGVWNLNLLLSL